MDVVPSAGGRGEEYEEMMQSISLSPPPRELYSYLPPWPMEFVGQMPLSPSLLMSQPPPSQPLPLPEHPVPMDADNPASGSGDGEDCGPWPVAVEGMQLFTSCPSPPRALYSEFSWSTLEFIGHMPASRQQSPVWSASPSLWNSDDEHILHPQTATFPAHAGGALVAVPAGTGGYGRNTKWRGYKTLRIVIGCIFYTKKIASLRTRKRPPPERTTTDDVLVKSRAKSQVWQHLTEDGARKDYAADSRTCGTTRLRRHLEDDHGVLWMETDAQDSGNSHCQSPLVLHPSYRPPEGNNGKAALGSCIGDAVQHCCLSEEQRFAANSRGWSKVFSNILVIGNEEPSKEIYAQKSGSTTTHLEAASCIGSVQHSVSKEPTNNAAKSRKTSKVWQHFREDGECHHCRIRLAADTAKDGTSSLRRHLKSVHNIIVGPSSKKRKLGCSPPPAASPAIKIPRREKRKDLPKELAAPVQEVATPDASAARKITRRRDKPSSWEVAPLVPPPRSSGAPPAANKRNTEAPSSVTVVASSQIAFAAAGGCSSGEVVASIAAESTPTISGQMTNDLGNAASLMKHAAEVFQSAVAREQELSAEIEKLRQEKAQVVNQASELQFRLEAKVAQVEELKAENTALKNQLQESRDSTHGSRQACTCNLVLLE